MPKVWVNGSILLATAAVLHHFAAASGIAQVLSFVLAACSVTYLLTFFKDFFMTMRNALPTPRAFLFIIGILAVAGLAISTGHCTPAVPVHTNSLGVVMYQDNPNAYVEGAIIGGSIVGTGRDIATNIRIQPSHTYALFTQELLICGGPSEELAKSAGVPVVLTYEVQAHRTVLGVGCHTLIGIDVVKGKDGL